MGPETDNIPPLPVTPPFRRRIILIKRALQMKYVTLVFVSVFLTVTIISLDVYYIIGKLLITELGGPNLFPLIKSASLLFAVHLSIYFLMVILISVFVSHKLAGPIFRLEKVSESIANGDLTVSVHLRQGDELFETAEAVNRMIESLKEKIQKDKNLSERISKKLTEIASGLKEGKLSVSQAVQLLNDLLVEVRHIASSFKL